MASDDELEEGQIEDNKTHKPVPKPILLTREIVDYSDIAISIDVRESLREMHHARQRSRISNSTSLSELMRHVRDKRQGFNYICASAAVSKAVKVMNKRSEADINDFLEIARGYLPEMRARETVNFIYSLAKSGQVGSGQDEAFISEILTHADLKLRDFKPQELASTIRALATLNYKDEAFIKQLLREAELKLISFKPQELANTIWALATLNYKDKVLIKQLLKETQPNLRDFNPQNLANTAWSLAVFDHSDAPSFLTRFLPLAYGLAVKMADEEKTQCLLYLLSMEDGEHVTAEIKSDPRYAKFRRMCQEANARSNNSTSRTQLEIFEAVRCLPGCSDATSELLTEDGLFSIDIALKLSGGQKLAIEVDGPYHFLTDCKTLNGRTILRNRLLENRGWKVISIPLSTEWSPLSGVVQIEAYLINKLSPFFIISSGDMKRS